MTREDWLNQVAQRMRPLFAKAGAELPECTAPQYAREIVPR